jgi:hypothetical protein
VEMAAVREIPDRKAAEGTGRPAALVETIFGSPAEAAPPGEPALAVRLDLASVGDPKAQPTGPAPALAAAPGRAKAPDQDLEPAVAPAWATELGLVEVGQELGQVVAPEQATELGQEAEAERDSEPAVVLAREADPVPGVEVVRAQPLEPSRPELAGGSPPRHY